MNKYSIMIVSMYCNSEILYVEVEAETRWLANDYISAILGDEYYVQCVTEVKNE